MSEHRALIFPTAASTQAATVSEHAHIGISPYHRGLPPGGSVRFLIEGTQTALTTYLDAALTTANQQTLTVSADGIIGPIFFNNEAGRSAVREVRGANGEVLRTETLLLSPLEADDPMAVDLTTINAKIADLTSRTTDAEKSVVSLDADKASQSDHNTLAARVTQTEQDIGGLEADLGGLPSGSATGRRPVDLPARSLWKDISQASVTRIRFYDGAGDNSADDLTSSMDTVVFTVTHEGNTVSDILRPDQALAEIPEASRGDARDNLGLGDVAVLDTISYEDLTSKPSIVSWVASPEQLLVDAGNYTYNTWAHGQTSPDFVEAYLVCATADLGYAVGDRVKMSTEVWEGTNLRQGGSVVGLNGTTAWLQTMGLTGERVTLIQKNSGSDGAAITLDRWRVRFYVGKLDA